MTNSKKTRRALLSSVLALLLCFAMLLGTTFAWFTDTASTSVNKIQAGTLKVDIVDGEGNTLVGKALSFHDKTGETVILWEPNATFETGTFNIKNDGNLALKYKLEINGVTGNSELLEAISFTIVDNDGKEVSISTFEGNLLPNAKSDGYYRIKAHMDENAGNEYQGLTIEGVSITVYATQYTHENDIYDNQYDKNATYSEGSAVITGDATLNGTYIATVGSGNKAGDMNAVYVKSGNVIIEDGYYDGNSGGNNAAVRADTGANVTIKNGYFTVGADAKGNGNTVIYANGGEITIEGGTFYTEYTYDNRYFTLNCKDNSGGKITIKGGKFYKFNPDETGTQGTTSYVGSNEIKVAEGYKVVQNGDWYYVIPKNATPVADVASLTDALNNGGEVALISDIQLNSYLNVSASGAVTMHLNGNEIIRTEGATGIYVGNADTVLNIYGDGDVTTPNEGVFVSAGIVNIYGGNYTSLQAVYVRGTGEVNIYGGTFKSENADYGSTYVLNQLDADRNTSSIKVYGGTFINFNPANNAAEGPNTNFVPDGYSVNTSTSGSNTVYTVVAD